MATRGVRKVGRMEQLGYPLGRSKRTYPVPTPEEAAASRAADEALMKRVFAEAEQRANERRRRASESAATRKIEDMKARTAVEGDTDLNHDNVEAADV